ncbi:MAG: hypothetical protein QF554_09495 [Dehalococcoidia bacterium]|jgi:hypothetical protein|nr:hypothetical protein [Dehalococcoidia bacterium]
MASGTTASGRDAWDRLGATFLIGSIFTILGLWGLWVVWFLGSSIFFKIGGWVGTDAEPAGVTAFHVRGPVVEPYLSFVMMFAGCLALAGGMIFLAIRSSDHIRSHANPDGTAQMWWSLGLGVVVIGLSGWCGYDYPTSEEIEIDTGVRQIVSSKTYLYRADKQDVIRFDDLKEIRYTSTKDHSMGSHDVDLPEAWIDLDVRGRGRVRIAEGFPRDVINVAEALAHTTNVKLVKKRR